MPYSTVTPDIYESFDVHTYFSTQFTLDLVTPVNGFPYFGYFFLS